MQSRVSDINQAASWYTELFGRPADFTPDPSIHEWELYTGCWLAVIEARPDPGRNRLRFSVEDLYAERARIEKSLGVTVSEPVFFENIVAYCDFEDPDGNRLGLFQAPPPNGPA